MMTNSSYITRFEAYLLTEQRASYNTIQAYKHDLEQLIAFFDTRAVTVSVATTADLKEFIALLCKDQMKASTRARKIAAIKSFYRYLHEHHGIANCAEELFIPKQEQLLPHYLSQDEIQLLFDAAGQDTSVCGKRNETMVHLLYGAGMRVSELVSLTISDIQFDASVVRVSLGKGNKQRLIPLPEMLTEMVRVYSTEVHPLLVHMESFDKGTLKTDYLFPHKMGKKIKPLTRQTVWAIIKRLCTAAGIKRSVSPHQLRHSLATHMLGAGADLRSLQLLLGHEKLSTVQVYTHVETSALRTMYDKKHPRSR
jgi:integrase/recombinase XerD